MGARSAAALPLVVAIQASLLVLLLQPTSILAQWYPPQWGPPNWQPPQWGAPNWQPPQWQNQSFGPPDLNATCEDVCGKGRCKVYSNSTRTSNESDGSYSYSYSYSYGCECEPGWDRSSNETGLEYLPCVIPNCTFSPSCPQNLTKQKPTFKSLPRFPFNQNETMDPCLWAICGEGTCNATSSISYSCVCKSGYKNMLNISSLPCFRDCGDGVGQQCQALGIGTTRTSASALSPSNKDGNKEGAATSGAPGRLLGSLFVLMASLLLVA